MVKVLATLLTYNSKRTIGLYLNSLKNQTFKGSEVIVVDYCSENKILEIIEKCSRSSKINNSIYSGC